MKYETSEFKPGITRLHIEGVPADFLYSERYWAALSARNRYNEARRKARWWGRWQAAHQMAVQP